MPLIWNINNSGIVEFYYNTLVYNRQGLNSDIKIP